MRIDIWSDVVCPWCFLGKRRFERAVTGLGGDVSVEVRWRAFRLDPRATTAPADLRTSIERKYGAGAFDGMVGRLTALGREEGIDYRFDRAVRVTTVDAHRLVAWAWDTGGTAAQTALVERLFVAYFEEGANVADHEQLAAQAAQAGLDPGEAADVLGSDRYRSDVEADLAAASERQLTGVPAFVVEDRLLIPGAQDVETFRQVIVRAAERFA